MASSSPTLPSSASSKVTFNIPPTPFPRRTISKMSITQTFHLARKARGKLSSEASRSDHNLRLLVGHANLLDSLMIHLSEAEAEQEQWYQNTIRGNERGEWTEDYDHEEYGSLAADYESDSESESDEEEEEGEQTVYKRTTYPLSPPRGPVIGVQEVDSDYDDDDYDTEDEDGMFTLTRTTSHRPPSLCSDVSDDDDEYDSQPPSPPQPTVHYPMSEKDLPSVPYFSSSLHDDPSDVLFEERLLPAMISSY